MDENADKKMECKCGQWHTQAEIDNLKANPDGQEHGMMDEAPAADAMPTDETPAA